METNEQKEKQIQLTPAQALKAFFTRDVVKQKFGELLGKNAASFITSILQIAASNDMLATADPKSIYEAAAVAATLNLPLNNSLGFAYIVPYKLKQPDGSYRVVAQFQLGYKGFIQLAQRTGQFKTLSAAPIYEGQLIEQDPLTGFVFDFKQKKSDKVIGYAAYFRLLNGFEKTLFMTEDDMRKHGTRYSQTFKRGFGLWKEEFDVMAVKTVLKLLLSKYAPLSIDMQRAVITDQAVIENAETNDVTYVDNDSDELAAGEAKENERIGLMIADAQTPEELAAIEPHVKSAEHKELFDSKKKIIEFKKVRRMA